MTAMMWLNELINLLNDEAIFFIPGILNVTLPCFSYGEDGLKKNILLKIIKIYICYLNFLFSLTIV